MFIGELWMEQKMPIIMQVFIHVTVDDWLSFQFLVTDSIDDCSLGRRVYRLKKFHSYFIRSP